MEKCPYCNGAGEVWGLPRGYESDGLEGCPACKNTGEVTKEQAEKIRLEMAKPDIDTFDMAQEERLWPSVEFDDTTY
jgi:RecJ-like exonuclease